MVIEELKNKMDKPLRQATLLFLVEGEKVLLAMKKRGFGEGKWNGVGGKPEVKEHIKKAAIRECKEEIGVTPSSLMHVATLDFYFLEQPIEKDWNQQVVVYISKKWSGEPRETFEMKPRWFNIKHIPYDEMWDDDKLWLPKVLAGHIIEAEFGFDENGKVKEHKIK